MTHPIHQATKNSPYGSLTKEEFNKKHQIVHQQNFITNNKNMKIFTQTWRLNPTFSPRLCGIVGMIHGYMSETSWLMELTAVAVAKAGFLVCALDLQGHGYSEGHPGHLPDLKVVVDDCIQFFDSTRAENNQNIPFFLYGESLGGAIAILMCLKDPTKWTGMVLQGALCGISRNMKPMWPIEKLLPIVATIAPKWNVVITPPPETISHKEIWKRELAQKSPNRKRFGSGKPLAATALEFIRICEFIERNCWQLEVPVLILHGGNDKVCDPDSAKKFYASIASKDKSLIIVDDMWHMLIGEPNETVELVFGRIMSWIEKRTEKHKISGDKQEDV